MEGSLAQLLIWTFTVAFIAYLFWKHPIRRRLAPPMPPAVPSEWSRHARAAEKARERARAEGFHIFIDWIYFQREQGGSTQDGLTVLSYEPPYVHYLVKHVKEGTRTVRIDIYRNEPARPLVRSLSEVEWVREKDISSRGLSRMVFRGVVTHGPGQGERQEWVFEYEP